jgi:hypothetical protein
MNDFCGVWSLHFRDRPKRIGLLSIENNDADPLVTFMPEPSGRPSAWPATINGTEITFQILFEGVRYECTGRLKSLGGIPCIDPSDESPSVMGGATTLVRRPVEEALALGADPEDDWTGNRPPVT